MSMLVVTSAMRANNIVADQCACNNITNSQKHNIKQHSWQI